MRITTVSSAASHRDEPLARIAVTILKVGGAAQPIIGSAALRTGTLVRALIRGEARMPDANLMLVLEQAAHDLLVWVGFGTLVGLTAKALMPGRDPGGAVGTLLMGIGGCLIGCGVALLFDNNYRISPISPLGFAAGTGGAFLLLLFFRILSNSYIVEAQDGKAPLAEGVSTLGFYRKRRRRAA